jgi:hypothetical protein
MLFLTEIQWLESDRDKRQKDFVRVCTACCESETLDGIPAEMI